MKLNFYIKPASLRKKDGRAAVFVSVHSHLGRIRKSIGVYVKPEAWDSAKQQIGKKEPFFSSLNARINAVSRSLHEGFALLGNKASELDVERMILEATEGKERVAEMLREQATGIGFAQWCGMVNEKQKHELSKNTLAARKHIASIVQSYQNGVKVEEMTEAWQSAFREWLVSKNLHNHTINLYLSRLQTVLKIAYEQGELSSPPAKIKNLKNKGSVIVYLSPEELKAFEQTEALINTKNLATMQLAKDFFLFMCYTGIRYSDFTLLTPANIKKRKGKYEYTLEYIAQKNNMEVICPLHKKAIQIIKRYEGQDAALLFPLLKKTAFIYNIKKHARNAQINTEVLDSYYLGNTLRQDKTPKYKLLSPHAARHTFATTYIAAGGNIIYLQKLMGHKSISMTQSYVELLKPRLEDDFYSVWGE